MENRLGEALKSERVRIISFRKVNGRSGEMMGYKFYELEYEMEVEYPNGLNTRCKKANIFLDIKCYEAEIREIGEKVKLINTITFEETER